jgi:hypothetical protein
MRRRARTHVRNMHEQLLGGTRPALLSLFAARGRR